MSKELVFKVVLQADTKDYVSNFKQSEDVTKAIVKTIKEEAEKLKDASEQAGKEVGKIVPDDLKKKADDAKAAVSEVSKAANDLENQAKTTGSSLKTASDGLQEVSNAVKQADGDLDKLGGGFDTVSNQVRETEIDTIRFADNLSKNLMVAANAIRDVGDKSVISAGELHAMSNTGEQGLKILNNELKAAQAELVRLQSTDGTLQDIELAKERVSSLRDSIKQTSTAFDYYKTTATNAMMGVNDAAGKTIAEVQKFTSVDLTHTVSEVQNTTRAIQSMGSGAVVSTKEVERLGQIGAKAIDVLERELQQAQNELNELSRASSHLNLDEFKSAQQKVASLEDALILTRNSMSEFHNAAQQATPIVNNFDKSLGNANQELNNFTQASDKANKELRETDKAADVAQKGISGIKSAWSALATAMAAVGIGLGIKDVLETADAYNTLAARIKIATDGGGNFAEAMTGVQRVAIATNTSLDATGTLFAKVNDIGKQMGLTQQQTLGLTETINKAMQLGGGSAQATEAAMVQLTQALQSGVLRGDEFNSVMEQAPGISKILAKELGVTTGELRKMAENGELTASRVVKAFQNQSAAVNAEYAQMPLTVSKALQKISTAWTVLVGELDTQAGNATGVIAQVLATLADNMGIVKVIFNDVMDGIEAIRERFGGLADDGTILAFKNAIGSLYDTFKTLVSTVFDLGGTLDDVFGVIVKNVSGSLVSFFGIVQDGDSDLNLINTTLNGISIALGLVSDAASGTKILIEFLSGAFLGLAGYVSKAFGEMIDFIPFMDSVAEQAKINGERLIAQGKKLIDQANEDAMAFESEAKKRLDRSVESSEQASARILAEKRKALDDTLALQSNEALGNAKLQAQKLAAVQAYANDAIKANNGILDKNLQLELAQKGYFAVVDEGGKTIVSTLTAQEQALAAATIKTKQQEEAFRSASTVGQKFGIDVAAETNKISKEFIQSKSSLIDFSDSLKSAGITGSQSADMIYQAWQKWMSQAKNTAEIDEGTKKIIEMGLAGQITGEQLSAGLKLADAAAKDLNPSLNAAREAGKSLGIDIDKTANIISKGFAQGSGQLDTLKQKLVEAGIVGKDAAASMFTAWQEWLKKADSKVELDAVKLKLRELASTGQITATQLKEGLSEVEIKLAAIKDAANPAIESFKRLGIETKGSLAATAKQAESDFDRIKASGSATADGISKAYKAAFESAVAAGNMSYSSWEKWVARATNPEDAETAKKILKDLGDSGAFSIYQVEKGLIAVDQQLTKMPNSIDPVTAAFKRLGIETKENLKLAAQQALADYETVRNSGQATAEGIEKAYKRALDAAAASGDASVIASANAERSSVKLQVQIDETGKASVKSMDELSSSLENVGHTASGSAAQGFRDLGRIAKQEAADVASSWEQAMAKVAAKRAAQSAETTKGLSQLSGDIDSMTEDYYNRLVAAGMDKKRARDAADKAKYSMNQGTSMSLRGMNSLDSGDTVRKMEQTLDFWENKGKTKANSGSLVIGGEIPNFKGTNSTYAPNIQAPTIQQPAMPNIDTGSPKTVTYKIEFGGKSLELVGDPNQQNLMNDFLSELEQLNRAR